MLHVIAECYDARVQRQYFGKYMNSRTIVYGDLIDSENAGKHNHFIIMVP